MYAGTQTPSAQGINSDRRNSLDFNQKIRAIKLGDLDQRDCGRSRWRNGSEETIAHFAVGRKVSHIAQEHRQLHEIAGRAVRRLQGGTQVLEYPLGLRSKIALADKIAVAIERRLAGDENDAARAHIHDLRVAGRRAELRWIDPPNRTCVRHRCTPCCLVIMTSWVGVFR